MRGIICRRVRRQVEELRYENGEGTFTASHRKAVHHHMPSSHFHGTFEIYCLMAGNRALFIKDRTLAIHEGDIVIISPNVLHRTTNAAVPQHERFIVNIHESYFAAVNGAYRAFMQPLFENEYLVIRCSLHERHAIETLIRTMLHELREQKPGFDMFAIALALQLLVICCRHVNQEHAAPVESPSAMHETITDIVRHINRHYMEPLSLQAVADIFYVSPYYVSRFFKEATGFTFVEYVNSVRIKEAKRLLEHTPLKVSLIANKVGFGSVTHFGRVFKSVTGHVPLFYRRTK